MIAMERTKNGDTISKYMENHTVKQFLAVQDPSTKRLESEMKLNDEKLMTTKKRLEIVECENRTLRENSDRLTRKQSDSEKQLKQMKNDQAKWEKEKRNKDRELRNLKDKNQILKRENCRLTTKLQQKEFGDERNEETLKYKRKTENREQDYRVLVPMKNFLKEKTKAKNESIQEPVNSETKDQILTHNHDHLEKDKICSKEGISKTKADNPRSQEVVEFGTKDQVRDSEGETNCSNITKEGTNQTRTDNPRDRKVLLIEKKDEISERKLEVPKRYKSCFKELVDQTQEEHESNQKIVKFERQNQIHEPEKDMHCYGKGIKQNEAVNASCQKTVKVETEKDIHCHKENNEPTEADNGGIDMEMKSEADFLNFASALTLSQTTNDNKRNMLQTFHITAQTVLVNN